jgi:hypothetical protein
MSVDKSKEGIWRAMQKHNAEKHEGPTPSGGSGNGGGMGSDIGVKDYVDARTDALESRLIGRLDQLAGKSTIWTAVATGTAIILAVLAFAGDRFDAGMGTADLRAAQIQRDDKQDASMRSVNEKLDKLIANQKPN